MLKTKIAVLVSGGGTNLQALIDAENSGLLKSGEIVLVASNNPNAFALQRAEDNGIKAVVMSSEEALLQVFREEGHRTGGACRLLEDSESGIYQRL